MLRTSVGVARRRIMVNLLGVAWGWSERNGLEVKRTAILSTHPIVAVCVTTGDIRSSDLLRKVTRYLLWLRMYCFTAVSTATVNDKKEYHAQVLWGVQSVPSCSSVVSGRRIQRESVARHWNQWTRRVLMGGSPHSSWYRRSPEMQHSTKIATRLRSVYPQRIPPCQSSPP